jgi:small GTP-binding protein
MRNYKSTEQEAKVVIVGRTTVGKTSIVNCALNGACAWDGTRPTVGVNFVTKRHQVNGTIVALHIWDTAGQERYRAMTPMYFRGAHIGVIVFSVIDRASFEEVPYWHDAITAASSGLLCVLVGNKTDCTEDRVIFPEDGEAAAARIGAQYCEASAKQGTGIEPLFDVIAGMTQSILVDHEALETPDPAAGDRSGCC